MHQILKDVEYMAHLLQALKCFQTSTSVELVFFPGTSLTLSNCLHVGLDELPTKRGLKRVQDWVGLYIRTQVKLTSVAPGLADTCGTCTENVQTGAEKHPGDFEIGPKKSTD